MAKKVDSSFNFLGIDPRLNVGDPNVVKAAVDQSINSNPVLFNAYHTKEILRPQLDEIRREKETERLRNINVNSFNYLAKKAGYDEGYASNLYNRIQDLPNLPEQQATAAYNELAKELDDLKEKGTTSSFGGFDYLSDIGEGLFEAARGATNISHELFGGAKYTDPQEWLGKNKNDQTAQAVLDELFTPSDIYKYAKRVLDSKQKEVSINKFKQNLGDVDGVLQLLESKSRNLNSGNSFDDLLLPVLENQFRTPGSDWYRDAEGELSPQYVKEFQNYVKQGFQEKFDDQSFVTNILNKPARYAKYDLETEALNDYKTVLQKGLFDLVDERRQLLDEEKLVKDSPEDKQYINKIERINSQLDKLVAREKSIDKVYGVSVGDRSGFFKATLGSGYMAFRDLRDFLTPDYFQGPESDANTQVIRNAMYKPEVLRYDKYGNPVLSNQVFYESASGTKANWRGFFESGGAIVGDMAPAIATGSILARGVSSGLALAGTEAGSATLGARVASTAAKTYDKVNKYGSLRLADRISTFATIYATTNERIYEQEKKWGGNAEERARYLAVAEAASEAIGFPDVGILKLTPFSRGLGAASKTAAGISLTRSELAKAYLRGGSEFAKTAVKANLVESFEEEMALLGEALVSHAYADEYARVGREQTEFTGENIIDTFVESFKGGLLYSGLMTGMNHYRATRKNALLDQAEYEAANNPELFKAKLKEMHQKNPSELSEKQLADAIVTIDNLSNTFKSLSQIDNLKDLNTFFDDEDARRQLFTKARQRDVLRSIDFDSLTPEQQEEFTKAKLGGKITKKATAEYNKARQQVSDFLAQTEGQTLSKEQTQEFVALQLKAAQLRSIANTIDLRKLTDSQMETLASMGIIEDKDFQFTQEDLDKMIAEVDTDILKTEKRAFQYAEMTKAEKAEAIKKAYDKKIEAINQVEDPTVLFESLVALKKDYEYLEKNAYGVNPEVLANKASLLDAYQQRFDALTQRDASGANLFEASLRELDINKAITDYNIYELVKLSSRLDQNKDHVDSAFAENLNEELLNAQAQIIENIQKLQGDQKIQALAKIMDQTVKFNTFTYFDQKAFSEFITSYTYGLDSETNEEVEQTMTVSITPEEFEKVRAEVIRMRGIRKSNSMAATGRVDNVSVPTESEEQEDAMRTLARNVAAASSELDDDGFSEKSALEKQYTDSFLKNKEVTEAVQALKDRVFSLFNEGSARAASVLNAFNTLLTNKDTISFDAQLQQVKQALKAEIDALRNVDKNSKSARALEGVLLELDLWTKATKKMVIQNPAANLGDLTNLEPSRTNVVDLQNDVLEEEFGDELTPAQVQTKQSEIDQLNQEAQRRRSRLLDLTSPARSNGIEVTPDNVIVTDPAVKRRVAFIDALSTMADTKVKILNKRQFLREYLASKYPQKNQADIEQDLKSLLTFFTNIPQDIVDNWDTLTNQDEILASVHQLLGKEFFDKGQLRYYVKNKAQGLLVNPEVIMTAASKDGKVLLQDSYPLELSFIQNTGEGNTKEFSTVPWRLSGRIQGESTDVKILPGDIIAAHTETFASKELLQEFLGKNDKSVLVDYEISEGVLTNKDSFSTMAEVESSDIKNASLKDFSIPTQPGSRVAGRRYKFNLGRLYFNNNGNPVILQNNKLNEEEIQAIAELVFNPPTGNISMSQLDEALFDLINQIDKNNRIVFFPAEALNQIQADGSLKTFYEQMLVPSLVQEVNGKRKYQKLTKEQFIKELGNYYYKVSPTFLSGGARFNESITRFQMKDGVPEVLKQPYLDYIKETHQAPINSEGNVSTVVNKIVYPSTTDLAAQTKALNLQIKNDQQLTSKGKTVGGVNPNSNARSLNPTAPQLNRTASATLNMIPYAEINSFLAKFGIPVKIGYSEEIYNQLVLAIKKDPSILSLVTARIENNQVVTSEYDGGNTKGINLLIGSVTLPNGQKYKVFFKPDEQSAGLNLNINKIEGGFTASVKNTDVPNPTPSNAPRVPSAVASDVVNKLSALNEKILVIDPTDEKFYIEVDKNGQRIGDKKYPRVSSLTGKREFSNKTAANRGTIIDSLLREFIKGNIKTEGQMMQAYKKIKETNQYPTDTFTVPFISDLFATFNGFVQSNPNLVFIADLPTLWGTFNGVDHAGTIDLLAIDNTNGKVYIIDLKTSTQDRTDTTNKFYESYTSADTIQQSAYAEALAQRTGIVIDGLKIFPIQVELSRETQTYESAIGNKRNSGYIYELTPDPKYFPSKTTPPIKSQVPSNINVESVTYQNSQYTVHLSKNPFSGLNEIVQIFNKDNAEIDVNSTTGKNVASQLDWGKINPSAPKKMSPADLMDAANQTPQTPAAQKQTKPLSAAVFNSEEENQGKQNKDACANPTDRFSQQGTTKVPRSIRKKP